MTEQPLISIVTVVFNGIKYLQQTIDSVANQTYPNIEYIIIDGGSTDGTVDLIKANEANVDHWISEPDKGLYDAMNKGISKAKGELIGMINSDDWYEVDAVETTVNKYLKNPDKRIFHSDRYDVYPDGEKKVFAFNPSVIKFKYFAMTYNHPSMFVSPKVYKEYNYNTSLKVYSDYQFTLTSYLKNKDQFTYINKPTVNFRLGGVSGQIPLKDVLKESYIARRNSGMNLFTSTIAIGCKLGLEIIKFVLNRK
ncbi:glycosyltransferase family 2 protein [Psychroserpens jangbogonensis]|uniref:glycosyltransferase family 2 protein n=1 Tax=Psychroserpens jangbogonensis TaxID=1484460 RepID=UPI000691C177|nr:glycosyltransferase family 2 protein [Psychroserpens jangbogonensis]